MVSPKRPFLSSAQISSLHDLMGQGFETVQNFQDPQTQILVKRKIGSGWTDVGSFHPVSIKLLNQQAIGGLLGNEVRKVGELKLWEVDYEPHPIVVGDRFVWQEQPCRITLVPPIRFGIVSIEFELIDEDV